MGIAGTDRGFGYMRRWPGPFLSVARIPCHGSVQPQASSVMSSPLLCPGTKEG